MYLDKEFMEELKAAFANISKVVAEFKGSLRDHQELQANLLLIKAKIWPIDEPKKEE